MKSVLAAVIALLSICSPASALDHGYWVVVGNMLPDQVIGGKTQNAIQAKIGRCGYEPFNDFSFKFGFKPGYITFVLGAYATKAEANAVLKSAKSCVPDAYIKYGAYAGE
ncbi:SPOR domain-containing protein [Allorhizobium borbori]|uniref:SPOR domain-containing protein n=1 Tax=Allorhizobium borbori TaxID=485907 RepID=A0A7W6P127_9HYPH|nr:SPOR domain-containing protein [Allorhizobium borbori]MBB4102426.1 hypothetical protein [Allorhizobium borbori]